ncbi:MAG: hypothetical protein AABZ06_14910 [Bdellovibrionota bacterium]
MKNAIQQEEPLRGLIAGAYPPNLPARKQQDAHGANARILAAGAFPQLKHALQEKIGKGITAHGALLEIIARKEIAGIIITRQRAKTQQV